MSEKNASLNLNVAVNGVAKASAEMAKAEQSIKRVADADEKAFQQFLKQERQMAAAVRTSSAAKPVSAIRGIKGALGEESTLGELTKLARGAGAIAGLAGGAMAIRNMAEVARDFSTEMRRGNVEIGATIEKLAAGIPVLGQLVLAGRAFREAITGEGFAIEEMNRRSGLIDKDITAGAARRTQTGAFVSASDARIKGVTAETARMGLGGFALQAVRAQQDQAAAREEATRRADDEAAKIRGDFSARRKALQGELSGIVIPNANEEWASGGVGAAPVRTGRIRNQGEIDTAQGERARLQTAINQLLRDEAQQLEQIAAARQKELQALQAQQNKAGAVMVGGFVRGGIGDMQAAIRNAIDGLNGSKAAREMGKAKPDVMDLQGRRDAAWNDRNGGYEASPMSPFFPGGSSLARSAAMERAQTGPSEGDKQIIQRLDVLIAAQAQADDTYR